MKDNNYAFRATLNQIYYLREKVCKKGGLSDAHIQEFLRLFCKITACQSVYLVEFVKDKEPDLLHAFSQDVQEGELRTFFNSIISQSWVSPLLSKADNMGYAIKQPRPQSQESLLAFVKLWLTTDTYLLIELLSRDLDKLRDVLLKAQLLADFFTDPYFESTSSESNHVEHNIAIKLSLVTDLLDLFVEVYESKGFQSSLYALCNGLAARFEEIDQVVLGWQEGAYVHVKAISHYERFERKTDTVKLFEAALEESVDQGQILDAFNQANPAQVNLAHQQLKTHLAANALLTLPVSDRKGEVRCGLTLISFDGEIKPERVQAVFFLMQVLIPKLDELFHRDAGLWIKSKYIAYQTLGRWFGRENLLVKSLILAFVSVLIASLSFKTMHYVSGTGQFVTDNTRLISAPIDGVVAEMFVTSGDHVESGEILLTIDTQDLFLQLTELQAELQRNLAEADRARAQFLSVDLAIAEARINQVRARIDRVNYQIKEARVTAPISGIVVEGQKNELISTPVSRGQHLIRLAQMEDLYLILRVSERDVHFLNQTAHGYFALLNQPDRKVAIEVTQLIPMANVSDQKGSEFILIAKIDDEREDWWRPGMTGVAKIAIEPRSFFWVYTHATFNRIRLALW